MTNDIQKWELTAFALGELPPGRTAVIEQAIAADSELASELVAVCETIGQVTSLLKSDPLPMTTLANKPNDLQRTAANSGHQVIARRRSWIEVIGLAATAACFLVAGFFTNEVLFHSLPTSTDASLSRNESSQPAEVDLQMAAASSSPKSTGVDEEVKVNKEDENLFGDVQIEFVQERGTVIAKGSKSDTQLVLNEIEKRKEDASSNPSTTGQVGMGMGGEGSGPMGNVSQLSNSLESQSKRMEAGQGKQVEDSTRRRKSSPQVSEKIETVATSVASPDGGTIVLGGVTRMADGRDLSEAQNPTPGVTRLFKSAASKDSSTLTMSVTPRIIIPEEEEESLIRQGDRGLQTESKLSEEARLSRKAMADETSGDRFDPIVENEFQVVDQSPFSTFSIDVDSASYSKARQYLLEANRLPQPSAVRIEELINYFRYEYEGPTGDLPFSSALAVADCPWQPKHRLVRIALQAKKIDNAQRPLSNLVFLLDVSGSMNEPNKLPLVKESMRLMIKQLGENDRVAMVVYAGAAGVVLDSTTGDKQQTILEALDRLTAGGSTNGGAGIQAAYQIAREHFIPGGTNRIILCTDGDFNVGVTSNAALVDLVEENAKSKVFLTVLGYGMGNSNDSMMEQITNRGNGLYGFVDSELEARRMMVEQLSGSLITVAKDVKIQVEFNPQQVAAYRLVGYENRMLATQDFNNDKKDAGEIGAGHCVTALYEIVPAGTKVDDGVPPVDAFRYQTPKQLTPVAKSEELLVVKLRYKQPEGDKSSLLEFPLTNAKRELKEADADFRWAASMAQFGMLLRGSKFKGDSNWDALLESAEAIADGSQDSYRKQTIEMIRAAKRLSAGR